MCALCGGITKLLMFFLGRVTDKSFVCVLRGGSETHLFSAIGEGNDTCLVCALGGGTDTPEGTDTRLMFFFHGVSIYV